jgi:hypothetical protein
MSLPGLPVFPPDSVGSNGDLAPVFAGRAAFMVFSPAHRITRGHQKSGDSSFA